MAFLGQAAVSGHSREAPNLGLFTLIVEPCSTFFILFYSIRLISVFA